jgi:hypothetical protein
MRMLAAAVLLASSGVALAQLGPAAGTTLRDGAQPAGTIQAPDRRLQLQQDQPPPNTQPFGGSIGTPIQETGNYSNLGLGTGTKPGAGGTGGGATPRSLVQPDYRQQGDTNPFQRQ